MAELLSKIMEMETKDVIMTIAVIAGPIFAVQAQKFVEGFKEKRSRRMNIFRSLMSTRAEKLSREHVQALNMIDIEFYGRRIPILNIRYQTPKEKSVTEAWKDYKNHLNKGSSASSDGDQSQWVNKMNDLFTTLLYKMSQSLGYDYDKVQLENDCYRPEAHNTIENLQVAILSGFADVINKQKPLNIRIVDIVNEQQTPKT